MDLNKLVDNIFLDFNEGRTRLSPPRFIEIPPDMGWGQLLLKQRKKLDDREQAILYRDAKAKYDKARLKRLIMGALESYQPQISEIAKQLKSINPDDEELLDQLISARENIINQIVMQIITKAAEPISKIYGVFLDESNVKETKKLQKSIKKHLVPELMKMFGPIVSPQELETMKNAVLYQPGSRWLPPIESKSLFSNEPKEKYRAALREIARGKRPIPQAWRALCASIDDTNKIELIEIAHDMDLGHHIRAKMTKKEICDFFKNYFAIAYSK